MSIGEYMYAWTVVNAALLAGSFAAVILYCQYAMQVARWRERRAAKSAPAPVAASEPTPGHHREERRTPRGWLVMENGMGAHAPTRMEANDLLDRCIAARADDLILTEIETAFNHGYHA